MHGGAQRCRRRTDAPEQALPAIYECDRACRRHALLAGATAENSAKARSIKTQSAKAAGLDQGARQHCPCARHRGFDLSEPARAVTIAHRIFGKIAANEYDQLGDSSTLADHTVVDGLVDNRMNR
jgi:hypothetical protein